MHYRTQCLLCILCKTELQGEGLSGSEDGTVLLVGEIVDFINYFEAGNSESDAAAKTVLIAGEK